MSSNNLKKAAYKKYFAALLAGTVTLSGCGNSNTPAKNDEVAADKETDKKEEQNVNIYSAPDQQKLYNPNNVEAYGYGTIFTVCTEQSLEELSSMGIIMNENIKLSDDLQVTFFPTRYDIPEIIKGYQDIYGDINIAGDLSNESLTQFIISIVSCNEPIVAEDLYETIIKPITGDQLRGNIYMMGPGPNVLKKEEVDQLLSAN